MCPQRRVQIQFYPYATVTQDKLKFWAHGRRSRFKGKLPSILSPFISSFFSLFVSNFFTSSSLSKNINLCVLSVYSKSFLYLCPFSIYVLFSFSISLSLSICFFLPVSHLNSSSLQLSLSSKIYCLLLKLIFAIPMKFRGVVNSRQSSNQACT